MGNTASYAITALLAFLIVGSGRNADTDRSEIRHIDSVRKEVTIKVPILEQKLDSLNIRGK